MHTVYANTWLKNKYLCGLRGQMTIYSSSGNLQTWHQDSETEAAWANSAIFAETR